MTSPVERTLAHAREELSLIVEKAERWQPFWVGSVTAATLEDGRTVDSGMLSQGGQRIDLFNCFDAVGVDPLGVVYWIQVCGDGEAAARIRKLRAHPVVARLCSRSEHRCEVWMWAKRGAAGKRKLWTLKRIRLEAEAEVTV